VDVLKSKPLSFNLYARRYEDRIPRRFLPSLHETQTEFGVSALMVGDRYTTEVGLSWRDVERTGNRLKQDDESLEVSRFYLDHTWRFSSDHSLRVQYEHEREQSTYQGSFYSFDTRRDEVRIEHDLSFGPQKKHRLHTYLRYNEEQGDWARDEIELVPQLTLQHTDAFRTVYRYGFYRIEQDAIEITRNKFDVEAHYQPSDRFRLSLDGFGLHERVDGDIDTYEFGGGLDAAFHQPTPWGNLDVNASLIVDQSRTAGDAGRRIVRGEAHAIGGSRPVYLRERHVIWSSIVAHNGRYTRIYVAGIDFTILPVADRIKIQWIPTGRIEQGQTVYFDYQYIVPARQEIMSYRSDLLIEHTFTFGLVPYYAYESRCEEIDADWTMGRGRDNQHRHRLGLRYQRTRGEIGTEYEVFDDSIEPYDAWHVTGRYALFRSSDHSLDLSGELSRYWFEGGVDDRRVWWLDLDLKDRYQINPFTHLVTGTSYHWERDSIDGQTQGLDAECGLQLVRGYLTVDVTVEYDLLSVLSNREQGFGVFLNVRRDLTHLLPASKGRF